MENNAEGPQKIKNRTTIWSSNCTSGYLSRENKNTNFKRYMHPYVHLKDICTPIICNSQDIDAVEVCTEKRVYKEDAVFWNVTHP